MFIKYKQLHQLCTKIIHPAPKNSINPIKEAIAYGYYFPKHWSESQTLKLLDPSMKKIKQLQIMRNRVGEHSGKILLKFNSHQYMKEIIDKYNQDYVTTQYEYQRVIIKPFQLKTLAKKEEHGEKRTKNYVKMTNLDFDITEKEVRRLAKDFGEVMLIEMNIRTNNLNDGAAKVYFKKEQQAKDFAHFANGLTYLERKFSASFMKYQPNKTNNKMQFISNPEFLMSKNTELYKRLVKQKVEGQRNEKKEEPQQNL